MESPNATSTRPDDSWLQRERNLPFSQKDFQTVLEVLNLPAATLEVMCSTSSLFQQHTIDSDVSDSTDLGKTSEQCVGAGESFER